jgi:hypothetical protein
MKEITINGQVYVLRDAREHAHFRNLEQRHEVAEKYLAEIQQMLRLGKSAASVNRKLQAARNVLLGRVDEPALLDPKIADAPLPEETLSLHDPVAFGDPGPVYAAINDSLTKVNGTEKP